MDDKINSIKQNETEKESDTNGEFVFSQKSNIVLTYKCNLSCPYCFANEFVNHNSNEISLENFNKAINFIAGEDVATVGLIGGEPLTHPLIDDFIDIIIKNNNIKSCTLYTNGILLEKHYKKLNHDKFRFLINFNHPDQLGSLYNNIINGLDKLYSSDTVKCFVNIGINIYKPDFDYSYIFDVLKKYNLSVLRYAITVPNCSKLSELESIEYFKSFKNTVIRFLKDCAERDIITHRDCNTIPSCIFSEDELAFIKKLIDDKKMNPDFFHSCNPVIDILPDLTAIRCFGLSEYTKVRIEKFKNPKILREYYFNNIDIFSKALCASKACISCKYRALSSCDGGCLIFKIQDILKLRNAAKQITKEHFKL